jgi:acetylglutamate kinase
MSEETPAQVNQKITERLNNALTAKNCTLLSGKSGNIVLIQAQQKSFMEDSEMDGKPIDVLVNFDDLKNMIEQLVPEIQSKEEEK